MDAKAQPQEKPWARLEHGHSRGDGLADHWAQHKGRVDGHNVHTRLARQLPRRLLRFSL